MDGLKANIPALVCLVSVGGRSCGYVPAGDTYRDRLIDLFRHQRVHVEQMNVQKESS